LTLRHPLPHIRVQAQLDNPGRFATMPTKFVPFQHLMGAKDYQKLLKRAEATSGDFALFLGSDRSTGYRWKRSQGPPNGAARLLQLMDSLGLTLDRAETIIEGGRKVGWRVIKPD
jgi:hypothetical protein